MSEKTCGSCDRFESGTCRIVEFFNPSMAGVVLGGDDACPAHDSGAFDEAVKQLISKIKDQPDGWNCEAEYKAVEEMMKERHNAKR